MHRIFPALLSVFAFLFIFNSSVFAQAPDLNLKETFAKGKVVEILKQGIESINGISVYSEQLKVQILEGKEKGNILVIDKSLDPKFLRQSADQKTSKGEEVVVKKQESQSKTQYFVYEPYRLNSLLYLVLFFLLFIIFVAGKRGIGAVVGLLISIAVIGFYIIPQILAGQDPLLVCILGSFAILLTSTYVAHGISVKTTVAVVSTAVSLLFAAFISIFFVGALHIFGLGSEDIYNLQLGNQNPINPKGLLLGSILIGTLGALNDITTTQAITIFTFVKENPKQKLLDLFEKGMDIGKEHIASLINTLVLAYAGSSLAVFIFFSLNPANLPWWVILNNEATIEEIVRSLAGSAALILAVPLTTLLAAWIALKKPFGI